MGTSKNQRSPRTPNWRAVDAAYTHAGTDVKRTAHEIWRAAWNEPEGGLASSLGTPIVARCLEAAQAATSATDAAQKIRRLLALSGEASFAGDLAQRAAVIAHGLEGDRTDAFVRSLFSEASNYLVSRDLPGFVGLAEKVRTVQSATALKVSIIREVASDVQSVPKPPGKLSNPTTWGRFVSSVVHHLSRTK